MRTRYTLWIGAVALGCAFCWHSAQSAPNAGADAELYRLFVDALEHIDESYVKKVDRRELIEAAINGMLEHLDPYSNFIPPVGKEQFDRSTTGNFGGIGVQIGPKDRDDDFLTVVSPLFGTPAYEAGILAGDRIVKVEGESLKGLSQSEVVEKLTGPAGTSVIILVHRRPFKDDPFEVKLQRAEIRIESVLGDQHLPSDQWDFLIDKENKIGYIRLIQFTQNSTEELKAALNLLNKDGMKGLVLDLRYNPGGLLKSAVEISDLFVEDGVIVSTKGRNTADKVYTAVKPGTLEQFPMVIMVNQFSASASEIVSACLQDHHRATIIGERTWGKGSVQNVIDLEDGKSALKLTTASYRRPNGKNIHRFKDSKEEDDWGVVPDIKAEFSQEDHQKYTQWRQRRDRIVGKKAGDAKPVEEPKAEEKPDPQAKLLEGFKDKQIEQALNTIRERLAKPAAEKKAS